MLPRNSGTFKSLHLLSTGGTLLALEQLGSRQFRTSGRACVRLSRYTFETGEVYKRFASIVFGLFYQKHVLDYTAVSMNQSTLSVNPTQAALQGYLAHKKQPPPLGPPYDPRHSPTVGSVGEAVYFERSTPVDSHLV